MTEHAPLPMATLSGPNHLVRYVNGSFCRLMNKTKAELVGKPFAKTVPEKDECLTLMDRVYRTGKYESHTEHQQAASHPVFWSYTIWPVIADTGPVGVMIQVTETAKFHEQTIAMTEALMIGLVRQDELLEAADFSNARLQEQISERKEAEAALQRAQAQLSDRAGQLEGLVAERTAELNATNQQLEAFVYSIAHDLRAPLRSMQGFSELLVTDANTTLSTSGRNFANRINQSAQFMDALLSDLLAFSRVSQQRVEMIPLKLETIVGSVVSRLQGDLRQNSGQIKRSGPWPLVMAHESTLIQVLFNLLSNALKFPVPGVPPRVRLWSEERGAFVRVWVEDNGIGIAPEYQNQIFGLFTRLHGEKYQGTGIGLAIVQKGVERMGGTVGVESAPGQGSRFWIELRSARTPPDASRRKPGSR